ncbi:MAG: AraC family ligand binding domain-containing protein, partial [Bacteroidota bacterium]
MKDFFKYLSVGEEDRDWGLYLTVAGRARIEAGVGYPNIEHPAGYYFSWASGRRVQEYQLNYITEGQGMLENDFGRFAIRPGTLMITRPNVWHRYRPDPAHGWVENYIGIGGSLIADFLQKSIFASQQTVIHCGMHEELLDCYAGIFDLVDREQPGYQQVAAGRVLQLLGLLVAFAKRRNFVGKPIEKIIQKIKLQMHEQVERPLDLQHLAEAHHIAYAYLRKQFKRYTGMSPHQHFQIEKIL